MIDDASGAAARRSASERERDHRRLAVLLRQRCYLTGSFRLASGKTSTTYFDCKRFTLDPEGLSLVSDLLLDLVDDMRAEGIA